ncbi:non-ribosomal peptide synthase/polyketide synthase [Longimicrobium sp.]|uniref:non-ribosomal peptide synthetase n=1 Tax=Longimicrobium sp. TaxID=2029185 RepID=UPI003B3A1F33
MSTTLSNAERERILEMARAARLQRSAPRISAIVPVERGGRLPLSFAQERLWFIDRLEPGAAVYNIPIAWRLEGTLHQVALQRALGEIVRRHEALRTVFAEVDGSPVQAIAPFDGFALPVEDLSGLGEADREAAVGRRVGEEARRGFDLAAGPLFRATLLRLGQEDHVLLLTMHHIVGDEWSTGVLLRELSALDTAYREGRESPLAELPVQYADFAVWQRAQLSGEALEKQLAYWRERLAGAPELLELPTDHPRPPVQTFRGAMAPVEFSLDLLERLQALGRGEGATLYMVLLSAFQVLLAKYGGSEDVVVGSPIAGRTRGEVEELIGFFVNTLVLRTDLSGDPSFRETLRRVREATLGAYAHQELPFEKLVAELRPERSLSHSPLFQVMFTVQDAAGRGGGGGGGEPLPGLSVRGAGAERASANFDLSLVLAPTPHGLRGGLNYSTDLFERGTVERMLGHLERVLEQVAEDADVRLSRLGLIGDAERARVLEAWNRTEAEYPADHSIHELFQEQAARAPEAVAATGGTVTLTYAELNARANRLARHLVRLGVGPETRVGVCLERGPELMVCTLATLKAGGAYVAMDPAYPPARLELMLRDSGAAVLLTDGRGAAPVEQDGVHVVRVDRDAHAWAAESADDLPGRAAARNAAYVVYTSGSTGTPKGVAVEHASLGALCAWHVRAFGVTAADRATQVASPGFDAAVWEVWPYLTCGASVHVVSEEVRADPPALRDWLVQHAITVSFIPTPVAEPMLALEWPADTALRWMLTGGDRLRARPRAGMPFALANNYGPTECTVVATSGVVEAEGARAPSIGGPIESTRVYVLDAGLRPLPVGVPGELCIGGAQVARGYLNRPGLTAERFVPDPFSAEGGARLYRSGDKVRWLADGTIEYLGRLDEQVKVRGFRIELGEIEAALRGAPGVVDSAVLAREDGTGDRRLVAYVVGGAEADALREQLRRSLPEYMVPTAFVPLDALPLTPNGKLDRKALPAPDLAPPEASYIAPRTPSEEMLAGVWGEMLGRERVGAEDSFFELGGHSLLATRVAARVREVLGVDLPLRSVFERPLLSQLAAEIDRLRGTGAVGADAIVPAAREGDLPVTFAQERLWFVDALDPGSPAYAIPFSYRIAGALDDDALRRALAELVRRHEPLRTTLPSVDGVPVQRIAAPPADFDLTVADLRHLPEDERPAEAGRLAAEASQHRFDLAAGPLFRASLVRVADDEHQLLLNLHHAIGDGWALGVLLEELSTLYGAFSRGEPSPLAQPALQYADYAVWQREQLSGAALERQVEFWRQALDGAPALLELPTDRPRPPVETHRGAVEHLVVSSGLTADVQALARREGATLFMVLLAALDVVLGRLAGQEDVVIGTPIAGRTRAETDRMVGLFLNSLALRTDLSGDPSFRELLGRVRETTLAAYAHQELPFERVREEVRPERSLAHAPVFQVMLNLLNFQGGAFRGEGLEVAGAGPGGEVSSKFDLTLYVGERGGEIFVNLVYAADLYDAPRMRVLLAQLEGVLRQAAAAPETRVGALSLTTEAAHGVLPDPAEPLDESWRGAVHEVFAARAMETPDALAVEDPRERWTYAELDAATDRLARALADAGVGVGDVVAITGHRSAALVRALLGTMKSGAAFLVLDPSYPSARLGDYVRIARPAAHLHLAAAADLPGEVAALLAETIRTRIVLHPRGDAAAEEVDGIAASTSPVAVEVGPDTLAYLSFTSGTTGTPKAVMGRHSALTHFTPWLASSFGLGAGDRFSLLSGLAHDPLHRDVFTPLQLGAAVVAPLPDETGTPGYLARWMREAGVTVAHLTPAMGQLLADAAEGERIDSLRRAFFVGDVLRRADVQRLVALAPNLRVFNYYGSTETQRAVSYHVVDPDAEQKEIIPLGRGIPGVQLLVRNAAGERAGIGEVGEIWMRSPHLAAGYLNDPVLSAERFLVNPWTGAPRDRLYRTGDLGRYRPDGEVEPMGRADQQVKVRGFRVELGEVESALASHPAIKEAAVLAREADAGDRRLVAYWVPADNAARPDPAELRTHLKALLPEYMVPSAYVRLDGLPLTANGKLDRRALPEPVISAEETRPAAPRTPTEEILAQIWAEVLRTETVGVDDDFFALGGHSLLATRLLARVQNALGVVLPLRALFEGPTVAELAARVEEVRRAGLPALPPVVRVDRDRPLPLSFAQERLWFLDRLEGGSAYNLAAALRLTGALDAAALERAFGEIVRRHESLRTVFREVDERAVQVIAPFAGFALPLDDLTGLDETAREAAVRRRAREDAARPFDLTGGPLIRAALLRLADEEHVLLLCIHHIVFDGWSSGVLFRELGALYAAYHQGEESPLSELAVQYADFAVWQREQLEGEVLDRQLAYWKARLADAPVLLELPTDRPRPPVQSHRGAREMFTLPRALLDRLQALGRGEGATLYMVMLSAFQLLLSKYSGSEDVVVGSPIAGRTRKEVEELIGFFANTLVLRTDLSADPTFRQLLGRVREGTLGAYEHQEVPFERLVAELQPERSLSHAPVFQVMFALQNADRSSSGLAGLRMEGVAAEVETTRFDLSLTAIPHDGGVGGVLEYSTDLFDRATIARMLGHLERVLQQAAADADVRLSELDLLSGDERGLVVEAWNRTEAEYPADRCIHQLVEAQAARTPDAVAVVFADASLTYGELDARANRLAHHLLELGAGPEARVGICVHRSAEMVVAMLAVLKSGAAYLPLDPSYPADRLAYMLMDSGAPLLVTQDSLRGLLPADGVRIVSVDEDAAAIASRSAAAPQTPVDAANAAYVIYTSGSTGRPKGVQVTHGNAVSFFAGMDERVGGPMPGTWLAVTRISFDIHVLELLWTLARGFKVVVQPEVEQARDGESIAEQIRRHAVTHLQCTPSLAAMLIAESGIGALSGLQRILLGGEALPSDLAAQITAALPDGLVNMYGPTETTVWSTTHAVEAADGLIPIGRPIANTRVYVLDAALRPQPVGVPGELFIGGHGVTRGYLGRPGLTAERFVPDAFSARPGARLYRTGDRARWTAEGVLEYLGRLDVQVKVRGFRIEPGEIEAVLRQAPGVADCAVVARTAGAGDTRLVAYVVGAADADALRAHVGRGLPDYMVPSAFVPLDALPLTPNGKLDRKALPAPDFAPAEEAYVAPRTPVEEVLAGIWAEVLRLDRVGVEESFFNLGGHSLLATRVVSRVRELFGVELPLRALFEGPTVARLAVRVEEMRRAELVALPPLVPAERTGPLPLSFAQERLWFIDRLEPGSATYNIPAAMRLAGALDQAALERALGEIVRRHEALRTVFAEVDGAPVQGVAPFGGFALPVEDLSGLSKADREVAVNRRAVEEARRGFDLAAGPLFRAALLRLGAQEHALLLSMHHIVSDGWSLGVFFRELSALYAAYREDGESPLPELPVQYADYALWQREQLAGETLDRQLSYWRERLSGAPELLELPTDRPRPPVQTFRGAQERIELSGELLDRLQALGRSEGATLYMTLLGAFQVLLSRYSGSEDIVVGSPIAGRTRKETEELIGFFVNTLVLRTDLSGDPSFREALRRVREATLGAYEHQEVPFERLVAELQPERSLSHSPLFQVSFTLDNAQDTGGGFAGLSVQGVGTQLEAAKFDLSLAFVATPRGLLGGLSYSTDLFERDTVERMLGHLARVLEQVAADTDVRLSQLELLGEAEREQVLETWNQTARETSDPPAHLLFAEWARRAPEATALLAGQDAVTYAALDRRAAVLARHLRELGVGPETPVGLCMERTPDLLVGVLGIWKAGGAYVPLDPSYPADRLAWMVTDAALPVVVVAESTAGVLPEHGATLVRVDQLPDTASDAAPELPASDARLAYVIYTSGSTGRPKGVQVQHGSLSNLLAATREAFGVGEGDVMPALASYAFDIWLFEALLPLTSGASVRLVDRERVLDVPALVEEIADATLVHAVPALMRQIVQAERETPRLVRLRRAFVGGDQVAADLLAEMREVFSAAESHVLYGPTEGTILASTHPVPADGRVEGHPIGRPLGNVRLYVCDAFGNAQPVGVPGELLIGGAGVARGYLGRAGLTAERFVPDPFGGELGARLYRTGDRARWRTDGTLEFMGRVDTQVKIRGFRIEPGEIEALLRGHECVSDCVVIAREDVPGDRRLVAYVVGDAEADTLREHLRGSLPEYMVPSAFVFLKALPLTPNGKLDRKALPAPEYAADADRYVAPRTPAEEQIAGIWAEVLKVERVGVHDNFFALGGHSLLAVTLVERMRRRGVRADVRALFTTPTVAELAAAVEGPGSDVQVPPNRIPAGSVAITPEMLPLVELTQAEIDRIVAGVPGGAENVQDIYPLAPLQEGILFHHRLSPESDPYLLPQPLAFESRERRDAYLAALHAAIARHDILRTSVVWDGLPEPVQVVWRHAPLSVEEVEVDPAAGDAARHLYERVDPLHQGVDLRHAPMLRVYVSRQAVAGRWGLLLLLHHMASDHTTADVLREEMEAYLEGRADQLPAPLPFRNYVAQARLGVSRAEHEAFFRELLGDVDEPTAPFGLREVHGDGLGLEPGMLRVEAELGVRLRERARALGVSVAAVCHVAWAQVLARVSGRSDVVFGTVLFGRMQGGEGADRVLGPFINTLPVRIGVGEGAEASVRRTQALLASLVRHEHASLALAQQMSGVPAPEPLFSALFNYRHAGGGGGRGGKGSARGPSQTLQVMERSNYPLNLAVNDWGDEFSLSVQAEAEVGAQRVCALMHTALAGLVQALENAPERPLDTIQVLPQAERRQVLEAWNRTDAELPADRCIHQLFEAQAARTPGAVALRFKDASLTYAQLNERANRLAHYLRRRGVGPEVRVGICLERSLEMVIGVLAVLKAGGAYVPLDPALPAERLAYVLEDSGVPLVLVQAALREAVPAREGVEVVEVDALAERLAAEPAENPVGGAGPESLAYVIYTSGSTGRPKGVMNHHGGVVNLLWSMRGTVAMAPTDRLLAITTLSFDISVLELFLPLLSGARVEVLDRATAADPALLREAVGAGAGTVLQATPATWRLLLDAGWEGAPGLRALSGGEALPAELATRLRARVGALWNVYGPTETTIWSTAQHLEAEVGRGQVSIGAPVANTRVYVLDRYLSPLPAGVPGELYIGGAGVARGYLGRPGLTAEKFVPDPFSAEPGARLYRTGDLARWQPDGTLDFLGRNDFQVKVRGFRIELGEIEAVLRQAPGVTDCAVAAREDETGDQRLVAYVVGDAEAAALRAHVRRSLPEYMVPSAFVPLEALPLTPNGKLDRKALPAPDLAPAEVAYVAPRTLVEEVLAGIWTEVLRRDRVGVHDSFFDLGGHSLLIMRLLAEIQDTFDLELTIRTVFSMPTLEAMAGEIERRIYEDAATLSDIAAEQLSESNPVAGV